MKINNAFPSEYLKAGDLNGKAVRVTIADVTMAKIGDDNKPIVHFVGKEKGLVLNRTNALTITVATSSEETDEWAGWSIVLYPTKVPYQGKQVDAIRVDDRPGASKPPVTARRAAAPAEDIDIPTVDEDPIPF